MSEEGLRTQRGGAAAEGRRGTSFLSLPHLSVHTGAGKLPLHGGELHPRGVCGGCGSLRECAGGRRRSPSSRKLSDSLISASELRTCFSWRPPHRDRASLPVQGPSAWQTRPGVPYLVKMVRPVWWLVLAG